VLRVLDEALNLRGRALAFDSSTPLLGALPKLDSMTVRAIINGLVNQFGIETISLMARLSPQWEA
jgi:hypothetical protein